MPFHNFRAHAELIEGKHPGSAYRVSQAQHIFLCSIWGNRGYHKDGSHAGLGLELPFWDVTHPHFHTQKCGWVTSISRAMRMRASTTTSCSWDRRIWQRNVTSRAVQKIKLMLCS